VAPPELLVADAFPAAVLRVPRAKADELRWRKVGKKSWHGRCPPDHVFPFEHTPSSSRCLMLLRDSSTRALQGR
jgi:hypothetical protein